MTSKLLSPAKAGFIFTFNCLPNTNVLAIIIRPHADEAVIGQRLDKVWADSLSQLRSRKRSFSSPKGVASAKAVKAP
jgi:hypothetical protein